jgi:Tfp pilus assembly protein PilF
LKLILSPAKPWQISPEWEKHRNYYLDTGAEVFLKQEVPYNITSNPCFSQQSAQLLKQAIHNSAQNQAFRILELGAGLGLFALHLLELLAPDTQIEYWLTDLSIATLKYIEMQPMAQKWIESGLLKLAVLDALNPKEIHDLAGNVLSIESGYFQAILANYQFSTLPTAVLYKQPQGWYQKTVQWESELVETEEITAFCQSWKNALLNRQWLEHIDPTHPQYLFFETLQAVQNNWADCLTPERWSLLPEDTELRAYLLEKISAEWHSALVKNEVLAPESNPESLYESIESLLLTPFFNSIEHTLPRIRRDGLAQIQLADFCPNQDSQIALVKLTEKLPLATIGFPLAAINLIEELAEWLSDQGMWLISDKGYADQSWMQGIHSEEASHHGDSLSHPLNFPYLEAFFQQNAYKVCTTNDEVYAIQTLWAYRVSERNSDWQTTFQSEFAQQNKNEESHAWLEAGHQALKLGNHEQAQRYLTRALRLRPQDATLRYLLSVNLLQQEKYLQAWEHLNSENDDYYGLFNFAILKAETCRLLEQYAEAIPHYQASLKRYGAASTVLYNLGLCFEQLQAHKAAQDVWLQALDLDPNDQEIQDSLKALKSVLL